MPNNGVEALQVGEVIAIRGTKITLKMFDSSNKETLFHNGIRFKGISIREHVIVRRAFKDIVCIVEGEQLDESRFDIDTGSTGKRYIRTVDLIPVGYFEGDKFREGIKHLPMIKDPVFLVSENQVQMIYGKGDNDFILGELLKEGIRVSLPWQKLFNSHIGIFGNTGSGKSNTLAKLYTLLFSVKVDTLPNRSKFFVLDFNGEYTNEQLVDASHKRVTHLNTRISEGRDKIYILEDEFWNTEILCILFKATVNTQTPFLNRVVNGRDRFKNLDESLDRYLKKTLELAFTAPAKKKETIILLTDIFRLTGLEGMVASLEKLDWHTNVDSFFDGGSIYFNKEGDYEKYFGELLTQISTNGLDPFDNLKVRCYLQLTRDLIGGYVQFDFISPLLKRMDSILSGLRKVVSIVTESSQTDEGSKFLEVISLRECNSEVKKILPLLITKQIYSIQKARVSTPPDHTCHIIIDEAHNILSKQTSSEEESWKDYRLELFEEIIKEGRKFGVFLTISSQRPADISPTIMSQVHNFFIHRLVNDKDLFLLDNTISTLDNLSKSMIPNLSTGSCIVTGTSFELPLVLQVDLMKKHFQPDSDDVDLEALWGVD